MSGPSSVPGVKSRVSPLLQTGAGLSTYLCALMVVRIVRVVHILRVIGIVRVIRIVRVLHARLYVHGSA